MQEFWPWHSKYNNKNGLVGLEGRLEWEEEGLRAEPWAGAPFHRQVGMGLTRDSEKSDPDTHVRARMCRFERWDDPHAVEGSARAPG